MKRILLSLLLAAVRLFYRRSRLGGALPPDGPVLLVANHPNGLVDPLLLHEATHRDVRFLGKSTLFELPVLGRLARTLGAIPVYRQQDGGAAELNAHAFRDVERALAEGELIALFPEGVSHNEPELVDLKTGAARMALGAEAAADWGLGVRIVPAGLTYADKGRFRSRVAVWVGQGLEVADWRPAYERDPRAAARELTEAIAERLAAVTLQLELWEDRPLIELAERIWRPASGPERVARTADLASGWRRLSEEEPDAAADLRERVESFRDRLVALDVRPGDLDVHYSFAGVARYAATNLAVLLLGAPVLLLGSLLWCLPYAGVALVARRVRPTPDLEATVKLLGAFVLYPLWLAGLALFALLQAGLGPALATLLLAPLLGLGALQLAAHRERFRDDVLVFFRLGRRTSVKALLARHRDELAAHIEELAQRRQNGPSGPSGGGV